MFTNHSCNFMYRSVSFCLSVCFFPTYKVLSNLIAHDIVNIRLSIISRIKQEAQPPAMQKSSFNGSYIPFFHQNEEESSVALALLVQDIQLLEDISGTA